MIISIAAIFAVMAVSCVFGYVLRGILDKSRRERLNGDYDCYTDYEEWGNED